MTQFLQDPEMQAVLIHVVDSEGDPLCGTAEVPAETITEDHWTEGLTTAQDVARLCPACDKQASERARAAHAAQQQEHAAETKRQATAAFVVAVDLAKAGGLSHAECHAAVDSRPHVTGNAEAGRAALGLLRSFVAAGAKNEGDYGLTADDMITQAKTLLADMGGESKETREDASR